MSATAIDSVAKGTLAERPFPRLLYFLFRKRITGRVALIDESADKSIVFLREGSPVHVDRPNELDRLDHVLADTGTVSRKKIAEAEAARASSGRRLGDLLEDMGILKHDELAAGLRLQLRRKLTRLFFQQKGSFEVFSDEHTFGKGADFAITRIDPKNIIYPGIRTAYDEARMTRELAQLSGRIFRLGAVPSVHIEEMGFLPTDQATLTRLRERGIRFEDLGSTGGRPGDVKAVILTLLYTDLLEIKSSTAPGVVTLAPGIKAASPDSLPPRRPGVPSAPAPQARSGPVVTAASGVVRGPMPASPAQASRSVQPSAAAAAARSPAAVAALRAKIADMAARLDKMNHFELLGLPETARTADVNGAYLAVVKQFHPDRMAGLGLGDLRAEGERIMARASEASAILSNDAKRMQYARSMKVSEADRARAMSVLEAELQFQKGETFLKKGDFAKAEEAFAESVRLNGDEPEHKALLAWTRFSNPASTGVTFSEVLQTIGEAVKARPRFARGHLFLGLMWKQKNDSRRAEEAFAAALQEDPGLVEAERELRLLRMRGQAGGKPTGTPAGGGGFFDRLRKR